LPEPLVNDGTGSGIRMSCIMNLQRLILIIAVLSVCGLAAWGVGQPSRWQVVSAYRTSLDGRTSAQAHNVRLAIASLDGRILQPGAEFSFNRVVGSWSADRGYVKAPVSFDGELIPNWGGGVCQASSTLYNAALLAGMEVTERHRHRFPARYVPVGQDAAVAQYNIDLRFRNIYNWPVRIEAKIEGDAVVCRFLSQRPLGKEITIEREIQQVLAPGEVVRATKGKSQSGRRVINNGAPGFRVSIFLMTNLDGQTLRTLISEDKYPPMNRLVMVE
jgi:vancomycin resistance protein VanW